MVDTLLRSDSAISCTSPGIQHADYVYELFHLCRRLLKEKRYISEGIDNYLETLMSYSKEDIIIENNFLQKGCCKRLFENQRNICF